jgi:hypothetical protein
VTAHTTLTPTATWMVPPSFTGGESTTTQEEPDRVVEKLFVLSLCKIKKDKKEIKLT